ncbi:unnamed protein product [Chrysoparadoxa australica]
MRIENLLLENIASFKGKTEIKFDEISKQSDLFAITGPTASGKSSILTSISMVLYGIHPKGLNSADIITMGQPKGRIECTFVTKGKKYHAEWTCSVLKKNGEFRKTPLITRILSDESGPLEESLEDIIGLTYDQFSKVVILNQGQFSTFLTSSFTERKDLLEKLLEHHDLKVLAKYLKSKISELEKEKESGLLLQESMKLMTEEEVKKKSELRASLEKKGEKDKRLLSLLETIQNRLKNTMEGEDKKVQIHKKIKDVTKETDLLSVKVNELKIPLVKEKKALDEEKTNFRKEIPILEEGEKILNRREKLLHEKEVQTRSLEELEKDLNQALLKEKEYDKNISTINSEIEDLRKKTGVVSVETLENSLSSKRKITQGTLSLEEVSERIKTITLQKSDVEKTGVELKKRLEDISEWFLKNGHIKDINEDINHSFSLIKENQKNYFETSKELGFLEEKDTLTSERLKKVKQEIDSLNEQTTLLNKENDLLEASLQELENGSKDIENEIKKERILRELFSLHAVDHNDSLNCPVCESSLTNKKRDEISSLLDSKDLLKKEQLFKEIQKDLESTKTTITKNLAKRSHLEASLEKNLKEHKNVEEEAITLRAKIQVLTKECKSISQIDEETLKLIEDKIKQYQSEEIKLSESRKRWTEINTQLKKEELKSSELENYLTEEKTRLSVILTDHSNFIDLEESELSQVLKTAQERDKKLRDISHLQQSKKDCEENIEKEKVGITKARESITRIENELITLREEFLKLNIPENPQSYRKQKEFDLNKREELYFDQEKEVLAIDLDLEKKKTIIRTLKEQLEEQLKLSVFYRSELQTEISQFLIAPDSEINIEDEADEYQKLSLYFEKVQLVLKQNESQTPSNLENSILQEFTSDYLDTVLSQIKHRVSQRRDDFIVIKTQLEENDKQRAKIQERAKELEKVEQQLSRLNFLAPFILKDSFRDFALEVLEETLLELANSEIDSLADGRYQLIHGKAGKKSELVVVDHWQSQSKRKVSTLSGGETFLLSLGLALGLSELTRGQTEVECFFIDEGFGTLDEESISQVLDCLMHIQSRWKQIGLISHVKLLTNQIPVRIELEKNHFGEATLNLN